MKLTFLGTGEAFDIYRGNYSCLIENEGRTVMVDCGYKAPYSLRKKLHEQGGSLLETPNSVLFTHFHGDHFDGTPALIVPMGDEIAQYNGQHQAKRERVLGVVSAHEDVEERFTRRMDESYPGLLKHFSEQGLRVRFLALSQDDIVEEMAVRFAETQHSVRNYAYRFTDSNGKSLAISGDGAFTEASRELFKGIDFLVHEGFFLKQPSKTHASIEDVVDFAVQAQIPRVAVVHVNQEQRIIGIRTNYIDSKLEYAEERGVDLFFPNDGYITVI